MKTKQTSKVQLSKENLQELLVVLKDFIVAELLETSKKDNSRMDRLYKSLANLDAILNAQRNRIAHIEFQTVCRVEKGHLFTIRSIGQSDIVFRCCKCGLEYTKSKYNLSRKERKILKAVLRGRK